MCRGGLSLTMNFMKSSKERREIFSSDIIPFLFSLRAQKETHFKQNYFLKVISFLLLLDCVNVQLIVLLNSVSDTKIIFHFKWKSISVCAILGSFSLDFGARDREVGDIVGSMQICHCGSQGATLLDGFVLKYEHSQIDKDWISEKI